MFSTESKLGCAGAVVLVILVILFSAVKVVDQSRTCAIVTLGNVVGVARTGFQLVTPFVTGLDCYSRQVVVYQTGEDQNKEADFWDYPVEIKSSDGQTAYLSFNASFHVEPENVINVRSNVASSMSGVKERVVANYARSVPRDIAPNYSATELYTEGRVEFEREITKVLRTKFLEYGVTLDDFTLRDVNFEEAYENAIEAQQVARERIETEQYNAQAAEFEAQKVIELAKGNAEETRIQAQADADALRIKAEAIKNNPELLTLEFIKALQSANWMMLPFDKLQGLIPLPDPVP